MKISTLHQTAPHTDNANTAKRDKHVPENSAHCIRCGQEIEEHSTALTVCDSCYILRSSCCPEFGPDDLWQ